MKLPTLYKKTATGVQQEWKIWTEGSVICTRWGQTGGAMQEARDEVKSGKNAGKKNETTPEQQAALEAKSLWEKKLKNKGYAQSAMAAMAGEVDELVEGGVSPMLAQSFDKHGGKIVWPCYVQPKLDGHRCIAVVEDGKCTLWSRTRKPINSVPHIVRALEELVEGDAVLDGELFAMPPEDPSPGEQIPSRPTFEELTSLIRQSEPKEGHEVVEYHVYDSPGIAGGFGARLKALQSFFREVHESSPLKLVYTEVAQSQDDLMKSFHSFIEKGFEGAMARNAHGEYAGKRSYDLQKVKLMQDDEFPVVGVEAGRGKMADKAIFVCQTKSGTKFNVKMKGKLSELEKFLKNPKLAIGKRLTVQFFDTTGANNVPRFPVGIRFREDL